MVFTPNHPLVETGGGAGAKEVKLFYEGCSNSHAAAVDTCAIGVATASGQTAFLLTSPLLPR